MLLQGGPPVVISCFTIYNPIYYSCCHKSIYILVIEVINKLLSREHCLEVSRSAISCKPKERSPSPTTPAAHSAPSAPVLRKAGQSPGTRRSAGGEERWGVEGTHGVLVSLGWCWGIFPMGNLLENGEICRISRDSRADNFYSYTFWSPLRANHEDIRIE